MFYRIMADITMLTHLFFVLWATLGCLLLLRKPRWVVVHLPCAIWAVVIITTPWICPLTDWEKAFRERAGQPVYEGGFIQHYLLQAVSPVGLDERILLPLGLLLFLLNLEIYRRLIRRWRGVSV